MDLSGIISISGKPGLFKVVAQSKNNIIVESLIDNKRIPAYSTDRISALEDISIYTYEEDVPLKEVYTSLATKENCGEGPSHKESLNKLSAYLEEILPDYDQDRVYPSDIKKLFQWYNILQKAGLIKLEEEKRKKKLKKKLQRKKQLKKQQIKNLQPKNQRRKKKRLRKLLQKKQQRKKIKKRNNLFIHKHFKFYVPSFIRDVIIFRKQYHNESYTSKKNIFTR